MKSIELIPIYTAKNKIEADILKGLLESHGIPVEEEPVFLGPPIGGMYPTGATTTHLGAWQLLVPQNRVTEAQSLLRSTIDKNQQSSAA